MEDGFRLREAPIVLASLIIFLVAVDAVIAEEDTCAGKYTTSTIGGSGEARSMGATATMLVTVETDSVTTWDLTQGGTPILEGQWITRREIGLGYSHNDQIAVDPRGFAFLPSGGDTHSPLKELDVFDLRDPEHPVLVRTFTVDWNDFAISGDILVGAGQKLDIVDVSDPYHPRWICDGCFDLTYGGNSSTASIAVAGNIVVAVNTQRFWMLDIAEPSRPTAVFSDWIEDDHRVWATDELAVVVGMVGGMTVIDFSDPTHPVKHDCGNWTNIRWVEFQGKTAYIDDRDSVVALDLSDPANPVEVQTFDIGVSSAAITGNRLYLGGALGITPVDIDAAPAVVSDLVPWNTAEWITVAGNLGLVSGSSVVRLFDLSDRANPAELDRVVFTGRTGRAAMNESLIAVPVDSREILLLSIDTESKLVVRGTISSDSCRVSQVIIDGSILTSAAECPERSGVVELHDLSNPDEPALLSRFETQNLIHAALMEDDLVYASSGGSLVIIDSSDPTTPFVRSSLEIEPCAGAFHTLVKHGDCIVLGSSRYHPDGCDNNIIAVDVGIPDQPVIGADSGRGVHWLVESDAGVFGGNADAFVVVDLNATCSTMSVEGFEFSTGESSGGAIDGDSVYLAARHSIERVDQDCHQPEVDFGWYQMGSVVQFYDMTAFRDLAWNTGFRRYWTWTFSNGERTLYSPRWVEVDFLLPGLYSATLEVRTEFGTESITKKIAVPRQPGLSPEHRSVEERVTP